MDTADRSAAAGIHPGQAGVHTSLDSGRPATSTDGSPNQTTGMNDLRPRSAGPEGERSLQAGFSRTPWPVHHLHGVRGHTAWAV